MRISDLAVGDSGDRWKWDAESIGSKLEVGNAADAFSCGQLIGSTVLVDLLASIVGEDEAGIAAQAKIVVLVGTVGNGCG